MGSVFPSAAYSLGLLPQLRFDSAPAHDQRLTYMPSRLHSSPWLQVEVGLPPAPSGKRWCRIVDTNLPAPRCVRACACAHGTMK